ncbi:MAG: tetratricopeptide repeat protein, partial [Planctomycetota bacterium]|nr:tetratricopeptide repeat protein [Planctomycetota bacterium]
MKTLQQIVSFRLVVAAMSVTLALSAQDEADALLGGNDVNPTEFMEQLKAAKALMTAEVWKPSTEKARVGGKVRDPEAEAKLHADGIRELDAIEKLKALPGNVRIELYQLRMLQYSKIQPDTIKYEKYVGRLLEIPDCPQDIRNEVEARQADLGSPWQVMRSYYVECLPEKVIEGRKKAYEVHTNKKIAATDFSKSPEMAEAYNSLGRMYWTDGENEKAEELFRAVMEQKDVQGSQVTPARIGDAMMFLASIELRRGN